MGGSYFSNGVALNIIESAEHPGRETWANINAIDDVVEFLAGDVSSMPRSDFLSGIPSLVERGITTVACVRGNAAAGGVALVAACDIVISAGTVVYNPAYRAMGLHGSEFHLYSYVERCGRATATHLVKDMLPLSANRACELGLVDVVLGGRDTPGATSEALMVEYVRTLAGAPAAALGTGNFPSAPWTKPSPTVMAPMDADSLVDRICENKRQRYESASHIPLVNYRHEELSQMLLDSFHPARSQRYHSRRIKFVRKVKAEATPTRFCQHRLHAKRDEEELPEFDNAPGWVRGEEWSWVGLQTPSSMSTSAGLLIDFAAPVPPLINRRTSSCSGSDPDIRTDLGSEMPLSPAVMSSHYLEVASPRNGIKRLSTREIDLTETKPVMIVATPPEERPQRILTQPFSDSVELLDTKSIPLASRSQVNIVAPPSPSPKRRGASFLGKITKVLRSRSDLKAEARSPTSPRVPSKDTPMSSATASSEELRRSAQPTTPATPTYRRPTIPNEGNTESPCHFNITSDYQDILRSDNRPTVISS